jgi:hypothetical protein
LPPSKISSPSAKGGRIKESSREAKPLFQKLFPLSFQGEGDKGGEVHLK